MENMLQTVPFFFDQHPVLLAMLNLLLKSTLIIAVTGLIAVSIARKTSSHRKHLLWLNSVLCLAVLFFLQSLFDGPLPGLGAAPQLFVLTVTPGATDPVVGGTSTTTLITALLLIPTALLLLRMAISVMVVFGISRRAVPLTDGHAVHLLKEKCVQLGISRPVRLRSSDEVHSPFSFGIFRPEIILPSNFRGWNESILSDVLVHELSHIRRLDWLSMLLCQWAICFYWFNPLVWVAAGKVDEEAEHSCDAVVIQQGRSNTEYAEHLLLIARECRDQRRLLAQMIVDRKLLANRITTILENAMKATKIDRKVIGLTLVLAVTVMVGLGNMQFISVQAQAQGPAPDQEFILLRDIIPMYPTRAAEEKIEGWVQVRFDVTPQGTVDADSIEVVDSEPAGVFDNSALRATPGFEFSPRLVNGEAVAVEGVEYVFRYQLEDYPEGQVWSDSYTGRESPVRN